MHAQQVTKIYLYIQFRIKLKIHKFRGTYQTIPLALFTMACLWQNATSLTYIRREKKSKAGPWALQYQLADIKQHG